MDTDFDVAIIGCGPVGTTLAIALGQRGLRVLAVEREKSIHHLPRAVCFDGEILRMYQGLGLADGIASVSTALRGFRYENEHGQALLDWDIPYDRTGSQGWGDAYMFHQPDVESQLRVEIASLPSVELRDGHEVVGLSQDDSRVHISVRAMDTGEGRTVTAAYAVGCDGAGSFVRRAIDSHFETLGPTQDWVVIDAVKLRALDLPEILTGYCWPSRPHMFVPMAEPRLRWELMVRPDDDVSTLGTTEGAYRLIERFATRADVRIERTAVYKFRSSLAERWRVARIFLAGDAAHLQPPLRAQGLCSGIRDAINLAWKLATVLQGEARDSLLDTYESERKAHARAWIEIATQLSSIINTTDSEVAAGRDSQMLANPMSYTNETPPLGPGLHGDAPPPAGVLSEQALLGDGTRLDDLTGWRFLVAMTPAVEAELTSTARDVIADEQWFHVLDSSSEVARELLRRHGASGALVVRPDRYVLGVADDAAGLEAVLDKWTAFASVKVPK